MAPPEVEFDDESAGETQVFSNKRINVCLTRSNYLLWKQQVVLTNRGLGLEGYLDGSVAAPAKLVRNRAGEQVVNPLYLQFVKQDSSLASWLLSTKGAQSMQDYTMNIKETCDLLAACGSLVSELEHNATILNGLPIEYEPYVAAITASKDTYSIDNVKDASKLGFQSLHVLVHPSGADFTTVAEGGTDSLSIGQNASENVASVQERASLSTPQPSHDSEGFEVPSAATTGADHTESPQGSAFQQANSPGADFQRADSQGAGFQRDDSQRTVVQDAESSERVIDKTQSVRGRSCMYAVCRSWQASLVDQKLNFPACLLLAEKKDSDERCLYNVSEEIFVELDFPEIRGRRLNPKVNDDDDEDENDNGDGDEDDDGDGDDNGDEDDDGDGDDDDEDEDKDKDDDGDEYSEKTIGFEIFKLDMQARCWEKMFSLGDSSLFLGNCCTFVIAAADYPGCRPNCIYLAEDEAVYFQHTGGVDMGIYNCENLKLDIGEVDESVVEVFPKSKDVQHLLRSFFSPPLWFIPSSR
ncbi:hypothetical protein GQ457_09G031100 [Hibiscus cannabinus]